MDYSLMFGNRNRFPVNDLADFFGVARPSVARAPSDMEEEGLIKAKAKSVKIIDKKQLGLLISE